MSFDYIRGLLVIYAFTSVKNEFQKPLLIVNAYENLRIHSRIGILQDKKFYNKLKEEQFLKA